MIRSFYTKKIIKKNRTLENLTLTYASWSSNICRETFRGLENKHNRYSSNFGRYSILNIRRLWHFTNREIILNINDDQQFRWTQEHKCSRKLRSFSGRNSRSCQMQNLELPNISQSNSYDNYNLFNLFLDI